MQDMQTTADSIGADLSQFPMHYSPFYQASKQKISDDSGFSDLFGEAHLKRCNLVLNLEDEPFEALVKCGELIQDNEDLLDWAGFYHYLLYDTHIISLNPTGLNFPIPNSSVMGKSRDLFVLLAQLSGLYRSVHRYRQLGVSDEIIRDTYRDVSLWMNWFRKHYKHWGFYNHSWLSYHAHTRIFRLGRLEYIASRFGKEVEVFRSKQTGEHLVLAQDRAIFAEDGLRLTRSEEKKYNDKLRSTSLFSRDKVLPERTWLVNHDRENVWLRPDEVAWYTVIKDEGIAERKQMTIVWDDYEPVLAEGLPVINVHIPQGEPLIQEDVHQSLINALRFFTREGHPTPFHAFICKAWVLDPQFDIILRRPSNILDYQDLFHLYPVVRNEQAGLRSIYGPHINRDLPQDWAQETTLQRSLLQFRNQGYRHTEGGGYILRDELIRQYTEEGRLEDGELKTTSIKKTAADNDQSQPVRKHELSG